MSANPARGEASLIVGGLALVLRPSFEAEADFASGAARLAGLAGLLLGWSPATLSSATPAELRAVLEEIASPSGGTIIDAEARAGLAAVIAALKSHGLTD